MAICALAALVMPYVPSIMDWSSQRVLLTGSAGFLGRAVAAALRARGVPESSLRGLRSREYDLLRSERAAAALTDFPGCTMVIHCAGLVGGLALNRAHPGRMFHDNMLMALNIVEAARASGLADRGGKVVLIGSMTSYPADAPLPYHEDSLFRGLPDREIAAYGIAKLAALQLLRAYHSEFGLRSACAVLVNLYGPGDNIDDEKRAHAAGSLMKRFVDAADRGLPEVVCWGTGTPSRDFLYIDDAAAGVLRVAEAVDDASAVNIASGRETTIKELTELIARLSGFGGRIAWDAAKGDGVGRRCLDIGKARALGWSPRTDLETGLAATIEWYRSRRG